mgnify:CR=1 FL=1
MRKPTRNMAVAAANAAVIAVFCLCAAGCKGRTMENMEPSGDTVEVSVDAPVDTVTDPES